MMSIDLLFLLGGIGLVALFALAAWLFVGAALRPVERARQRERQFVSDAAHELRTPLTGLRAQLAVVRRSLARPAVAADELSRAEDSASRLGELASNLLELARLDEGTPSTVATATELRQAFLAAVDDVRMTPGASRVNLEQVSPAAMPQLVARLDAVSFGRVVRNLLANALAATAPNGTISARLSATAGELELVVHDDGPGFPADLRDRAVDRFARGEGTSGSGLGLALVDALARSAGGTVELANTDPGARVTVRIPLH